MSSEEKTAFQSLRVNKTNKTFFAQPDLDLIPDFYHSNLKLFSEVVNRSFCGERLKELRAEAQRHLLEKALDWTESYLPDSALVKRLKSADQSGYSIILTGHQPELFHPGVWSKNFLLHQLASRLNAVPIHFIVDSDVQNNSSIKVPTGTSENPAFEFIPYDKPEKVLTSEFTQVNHRELWSSFSERVKAKISNLISNPIVDSLWPIVLERERDTNSIGYAFAQARHLIESELSIETLEVPLSRTLDSPSFITFFLDLANQIEDFSKIYNDSIDEYRVAHRIRSKKHPVPKLAQKDDEFELPFWIFSKNSMERKPLWVQKKNKNLIFSDQSVIEFSVSEQDLKNKEKRNTWFTWLKENQVFIRTRALTTTIWTRLFLSDLFIHGIGGGKYDQLTDLIIDRFWNITPPKFVTFTGTLHLPIVQQPSNIPSKSQIQQDLRDLDYNPDRWLRNNPMPEYINSLASQKELQNWIGEKSKWITKEISSSDLKTRHQKIHEANTFLGSKLKPERERLIHLKQVASQKERDQQILNSREYSFCLFPFEILSFFFLPFIKKYPYLGEN